jgi:hypothetical protein
VFDPERDNDSSGFWRRLLLVALLSAAVGAVVLPSVTGFRAGIGGSCVAIRDGWRAARSPDSSDQSVSELSPVHSTPQQVQDMDSANARLAQIEASDACVPESRHRLILSGAGLIGLAVVTTATTFVRRRMCRSGEGNPALPALRPTPSG